MPCKILPRAKEIYTHLMTLERPSLYASHQYLPNTSNSTTHSRQSCPVNRAFSGATSSSIILSQSPADRERLLYDVYANIMAILRYEIDDNQATILLTDLLKKFIEIHDGLFANVSIDEILNNSVRFRETPQEPASIARNSQHFESIISENILPGSDLDDDMDEDLFYNIQLEPAIASRNENVDDSPNSAAIICSSLSDELENIQSICYSPQSVERLNPSGLSTMLNSINNHSNSFASPNRELRKTDFSIVSSPMLGTLDTQQFSLPSTNSHPSQLQIFNDDMFSNIVASHQTEFAKFRSPALTKSLKNTALFEMVGADPDDFQNPFITPSRLPVISSTLLNFSDNNFPIGLCSDVSVANSLLNFIAKNVDTPITMQSINLQDSRQPLRKPPVDIAAFTV